MEFEFLPKLPKSDLDDRAYKDLVEECLLRIPRYCPEWTNYNPSDPGITLVELFAWLTDQMQLRFNQVPRRNYVAFLELLGIRLRPPTAAHTELTFYLSSAQPFPLRIPRDTEVATERTATEEAIVFSTDHELIVGNPRLKHFLTADLDQVRPTREELRNRFSNSVMERDFTWEAMGPTSLFNESQIGNCFYLVLETISASHGQVNATDEVQSIQGNVLELLLRGEPATGTGINPDEPPRFWEAWDGHKWRSILRQELDDKTKGFNFDSGDALGQNRLREASIILHLPQHLEEDDFGTSYRGYWIRCVYQPTRRQRSELQQLYSTSPRIVGLAVRSIGGTVAASQCIRVQEELLGTSTGKPGQVFDLQMQPVLERDTDIEHIEIRAIGALPEPWNEVSGFGQSNPTDRHYTIDARTGTVQFGPLIRGPMRLRKQTIDRIQSQASFQPDAGVIRRENGRVQTTTLSALPNVVDRETAATIERQYGRVPPPGAEIYMTSYRFGGGKRGNVQPEKLTVLRSSLAYISRVTNYKAAEGGADEESLEEAVIRVPQLLRTRECAVTPEDFETIAKQFPGNTIARAHCLTELKYTTPGVVRLLVVPAATTETIDWTRGMNPREYFSLRDELRHALDVYFRDRRPLGIHVKPEAPDYVGVSVRVNVLLNAEPKYNTPRVRADISAQLQTALYQFLNPLTGGVDGDGWVLGCPVYISDIIALCQKVQGIRHVGSVQLFEVRDDDGWNLYQAADSVVDPGALGLICSWAGGTIAFAPHGKSDPGHEIHFLE